MIGRMILDIPEGLEFAKGLVVSRFGVNAAGLHELTPRDTIRLPKLTFDPGVAQCCGKCNVDGS